MLKMFNVYSNGAIDSDTVSVEIDEAKLARIKQLVKAANDLDVLQIEIEDIEPTFYNDNGSIADIRSECVRLCVQRDSIFWRGYIKQTDTRWDTDVLNLKELS